MLIPGNIEIYAHQLMEVRANARILPLLSQAQPITIEDANSIARRIMGFRMALGEKPVGKKIMFNVRAETLLFGEEDRREPIWAPIYNTTIRHADHNHGIQSLAGAVQPCIAPQIVFKLGTTPPVGASMEELTECVEWVAHGLEIVSCPFAGWTFTIADAIAAFGLHGTLIIGEPHALSFATQNKLATMLDNASLSMSGTENKHGMMSGVGFCSDDLDHPVHALWHLHRLLYRQSLFAPLQEGELVSVGVWTETYPVAGHQTWTTQFTGIDLPGMTLQFV
jgi:2-keto-4-pentenoate hydratase